MTIESNSTFHLKTTAFPFLESECSNRGELAFQRRKNERTHYIGGTIWVVQMSRSKSIGNIATAISHFKAEAPLVNLNKNQISEYHLWITKRFRRLFCKDMLHDRLPVIRMKPAYLGIPSPPRELLAGIMPAIALDETYRLG